MKRSLQIVIALVVIVQVVVVAVLIRDVSKRDERIDRLEQRLAERGQYVPPPVSGSGDRVVGEDASELVRTVNQLQGELGDANAMIVQLSDQLQEVIEVMDAGTRNVVRGKSQSSAAAAAYQRAQERALAKGRRWGPEQATGPPDTEVHGDIVTAWASQNPDGGEEWLELDYDDSVSLAEINVHESYNPGAISKVAAILPDGTEQVIWEGVMQRDGNGPERVESSFAAQGDVSADRIKVYLDTTRVPGWNEIDAVELVGSDGSRQWASDIRSSSTFGQ